jgi:transcriptional regulator with XRE-family HTH domain
MAPKEGDDMAEDPRRVPETPEVMRRRLRVALRKAREAIDLTQRKAAEALDWSVSKIIRIEQGAVAITPVDLRALLEVYGVTDKDLVEELVGLARESKRQSWERYKDVYTPASLSLFGHEAAARTIYSYEPAFVPGLLQTQEYAEEILRELGVPEEQIDTKVAGRIERQGLLDREPRPKIRFIFGEAALSREVGSRHVMMRQLEWIRKLGERPGISLQVLPFSAGAHPHVGGAFTILEFEDENLDDLLYLEDAAGTRTFREEPDVLSDYYKTFSLLEGMATNPGDLNTVLDKIQEERFSDAADPLIASSTSR